MGHKTAAKTVSIWRRMLKQAADVLPSAETLDKLLRYETALQKKLFRAMNHLERLQRRRMGENIPAPVTMEISTGA